MKNTFKDFIIAVLIVAVITAALVFYIRSVSTHKEEPLVPYRGDKFSMYIEDTTGTVEWNEKLDTVYTDDYGITHVEYENK